MAQNTTSNRGYDDTVYIPRQQRLRPMILTRKVQQFYLVYLCFPDGSEMQIAAYMMPNDGNWRANDAFYDSPGTDLQKADQRSFITMLSRQAMVQ